MGKIDRDMLSIAGEFAVASELGRRNIYAQPTFGHLKRTDLLILDKTGNLLKMKKSKLKANRDRSGQIAKAYQALIPSWF